MILEIRVYIIFKRYANFLKSADLLAHLTLVTMVTIQVTMKTVYTGYDDYCGYPDN